MQTVSRGYKSEWLDAAEPTTAETVDIKNTEAKTRMICFVLIGIYLLSEISNAVYILLYYSVKRVLVITGLALGVAKIAALAKVV